MFFDVKKTVHESAPCLMHALLKRLHLLFHFACNRGLLSSVPRHKESARFDGIRQMNSKEAENNHDCRKLEAQPSSTLWTEWLICFSTE